MNKINNWLVDLEAVKFDFDKGFTFSSGIKSPIYIDTRLLITCPEKREYIIKKLVQIAKKNNLGGVAGVATGALPYASFLAYKLKLPMVYVRKNPKGYGLEKKVEGIIEKGIEYGIVEDVISTGNSILQADNAIKAEGGKTSVAISIFNYEFNKTTKICQQNKLKVYTLTNLEKLLQTCKKRKIISKKEILKVREWKNSLQ